MDLSELKANMDAKIRSLKPETISFWYEVLNEGLQQFWAKTMTYKEFEYLQTQAFADINVLAINYVGELGRARAETRVGKHLTLSECEEFWYEMMMAADHHLSLDTPGVMDVDFNRAQELWACYGQMPSYLFAPGMNEDVFRCG